MADFTPQEDRLIEERLADDIGYKKIAGALGRRLDKHVKDHIHELRERLRLPLGSDSSSAYSTSTVPLPQRQITSTDGKITIDIGLQIQAHKRKDDNESVALYEGRYQDKDVVVKVFCLLGDHFHSNRALQESLALQQLTNRGCKHAPQYITEFAKGYDGLICGHEIYIIMSKVPGVPVYQVRHNFTNWPPGTDSETGEEEQGELEKAFRTAISDVHGCEVDNGSHFDDNTIWDAEERKCYIIDFERAVLSSPWKAYESLGAWPTRM